jgi:hypothetical protein
MGTSTILTTQDTIYCILLAICWPDRDTEFDKETEKIAGELEEMAGETKAKTGYKKPSRLLQRATR